MGDQLSVSTTIDENADIQSFAYMLLFLQQGRYLGPIAAAITAEAEKTAQMDKGELILSVLSQHRQQKQKPASKGKSLIPPRKAVAHNFKMYQNS